jgi:hypothetical protein
VYRRSMLTFYSFFARHPVTVRWRITVFRQNNIRVETDLVHAYVGRFANDLRLGRAD